jgi:hypothetical protein
MLSKLWKKKKGKQKRLKRKGRKKKSDLIISQYTKACKSGANWDQQGFKKTCSTTIWFFLL